MASRQEFLQCICPSMRMDDQDLFKRIYGYELTWPGFADQAIARLETSGFSQAREKYEKTADSYKTKYSETLAKASEWYLKRIPRRQNLPKKDEQICTQTKEQNWKEIEALKTAMRKLNQNHQNP